MSENKRQNHPEFVKYQEFIVNHSNYRGLHFSRNLNGSIRWVVTGKSEEGRQRRKWWLAKCEALGIKIEAGALAKAAVAVHPTKIHVCQICGKGLQIEYVYPNKRLLSKIKSEFHVEYAAFEKDVFEILDELAIDAENLQKLSKLFKTYARTVEELKNWISETERVDEN
jgi:hypothetical protein